MTYRDYFMKWLRSPYAVREETMNNILECYQRGDYNQQISEADMPSLKYLLNRMILHQEETTRKRIELNLPLK